MQEMRAWERQHGTEHDWTEYQAEIVPVIQTLTAYLEPLTLRPICDFR